MGIGEAVEWFREEYPECQDPDLVYDRCHVVSDAFVALLAEAGVAAEVVGGFETAELPGGGVLILRGHMAVLVGETVYDWTARQFDPSAPVPLVVCVEEWRRVWRAL